MRDDVAHREMLEQRDDVGETFVERQRVLIDRLDRSTTHSVEDRMRRFVGDDVLRKTSEDPLSFRGTRRETFEITEKKGRLVRAVICVGLSHGVWINPKALLQIGVTAAATRSVALFGRGWLYPKNVAAQCAFEIPDRVHGDRKHHLLMELRAAFAWRQPILREQHGIVEIDRLVK